MENQRGNALFLILIAVALFAALSYAVTQSGRGGSGIDKEQATLAASQIIQHVGQLESSINRLLIINGCSDTELSFWHDSDQNSIEDASDEYYNANAPTDRSCHIYDVAGGGVTYQTPDVEWLDSSQSSIEHYGSYYTTGIHWLRGVGTDGNGSNCFGGASDSSCSDLVTGVPFIKEEICREINRRLGWGDSNGAPVSDAGNSYGFNNASGGHPFTGVYRDGASVSMGAATPTAYSGVYSGCIEGDASPAAGVYSFFHVLIAR